MFVHHFAANLLHFWPYLSALFCLLESGFYFKYKTQEKISKKYPFLKEHRRPDHRAVLVLLPPSCTSFLLTHNIVFFVFFFFYCVFVCIFSFPFNSSLAFFPSRARRVLLQSSSVPPSLLTCIITLVGIYSCCFFAIGDSL